MLVRQVLMCILMVVFSFQSEAYAYFRTGNDLASLVAEFQKANRKDPSAKYEDAHFFVAYVIGVYDSSEDRHLFCTPNNLAISQTTAIVAKYLDSHPEHWSKP